MTLSETIILSKLTPPQPHHPIFQRPRLKEKLKASAQFPLTIIHAGTGFGKTTALLALCKFFKRTYWYNITEPDRDPTLFIAHLISAFLPESRNLVERLEKGGFTSAGPILTTLINQLTTDLEEDVVLVLDDYHLVSTVSDIRSWVETIIEQRPPRLHIAIACRQIPETPAFIRWRVKGSVLVIDQKDLSLDTEEIAALFSVHHNFPITDEQTQSLFSYTDGWIIALEMIWQRLQSSRSKKLDNILAELPLALSDIFTFLAQEVLMRQPLPIQDFLISSSILRQMTAPACSAVTGNSNCQSILEQLTEKGLFISTVDNTSFHFQRLFQDFLLSQVLKAEDKLFELHHKAADFYISQNELEEAIFHRLSANDKREAARLINLIGERLLEIGRLRTLAKWIEQLSEEEINEYPSLYLLLGDVQRLRSRFENAVNSYNQAEKIYIQLKDVRGRSRALRSKAQVYLDTIRPLKASSLLEEAISLLEPQEYPGEVSELLDQLAENKLNLGQPQEAIELHNEALLLQKDSDPNDIYLEARSYLRTGRLFEARDLLEFAENHNTRDDTQRPQRFHREMPLLLSLIHLMLGNVEKGEFFSRKGIGIGRQLDSPFVEAVGLMRLGHSYQLYPHLPWRTSRLAKAKDFYQHSIELVKPFNVVRVQVEPLWGLCRFYGYQGLIEEAGRLATQATEIANTAGDYWFVALIATTLGTSYALSADRENAETFLMKAITGFEQVGDRFGQTAAHVALTFNMWINGDKNSALNHFNDLAPKIRSLDFNFLLTRPSHIGIQDSQQMLPLLLEAQKQGIEPDWIGRILKENGIDELNFHPGYELRIRTLGPFEVWRGPILINQRDWQREKARQLFQFFIASRGKWFSREQIADRIWPQLDGEGSTQNLKVALNALNRALEPEREAGMSPFFITRRETLYGINPAAKISLDIDDFIQLSKSDSEEDLLEALSIYQGDFLMEVFDDVWTKELRDQMRSTFLQTAKHLSQLYFQQERWDAAIKISHEILTMDACNEDAFQMLMLCHAARGNRTIVHSVYQRCVAVLKDDLDVEPSLETTLTYQRLTNE